MVSERVVASVVAVGMLSKGSAFACWYTLSFAPDNLSDWLTENGSVMFMFPGSFSFLFCVLNFFSVHTVLIILFANVSGSLRTCGLTWRGGGWGLCDYLSACWSQTEWLNCVFFTLFKCLYFFEHNRFSLRHVHSLIH